VGGGAAFGGDKCKGREEERVLPLQKGNLRRREKVIRKNQGKIRKSLNVSWKNQKGP